MAATSKREVLTCVAFAYFAVERNKSNLDDFEALINTFYNNDNTALDKYKSHVSKALNFDAIRKIDNKEKKNDNSALVQEILSAYWSAEVLYNTKKLYNGNFSNYIFLDQNDPVTEKLKDAPLKKIKTLLDISESVPADILSSIDVFMIQKDKLKTILSEIDKHILNATNVQILNNLAYGKTGKNTYRTLYNKFFADGFLIPISLKKIASTKTRRPVMKASIEIVGTSNVNEDLKLLVDPYTEFLGIISELKDKAKVNKLIENMVQLDDAIRMGDTRTYFQVDFSLNYKKVNIANKIQKAYFEIGRNGFNGGKVGPQPWFGGASYTVTLPILKKYSKFSTLVREMVTMREKAFKHVVDTKKASKIESYKDALSIVKSDKLVLFNENDVMPIKKFCAEYDSLINAKKDSYQEFRIAVINLCKNRPLTYPSAELRSLDKLSTKKDNNKSLQNQFAHSQGLWMYTRNNSNMKDFLKKQITLTIYGIITKKGAKIFESNSNNLMLEDAYTKEITSNNGTKKLAKFLIAPHIIID